MNLEERLAELIEQLEAAETIEDARAIRDQIDELLDQIDVAEEKAAILENMKSRRAVTVKAGDGNTDDLTIGQKAAIAVIAKGATGKEKFTVSSANAKAATDPNGRPTGDYFDVLTEYKPDVIEGARRPLTVADLFAAETTEKAAVTYFIEGAVEGSITTVKEGGKYPTLSFGDPTSQTDALKKVGCVYKDTDELLDDAPRLAQNIDNRADYLMDITEEDQLLSGDGQGNNIVGLLKRNGLQVATCTSIEAAIDAIKSAKSGIKKNTPGFRADGLLINDEDWDELTSTKDANKQYLAGGPFYGPYGNGNGPAEEPPLWGLRVVPTQAIAKGTMVIGAFKLGGSVIRKGGRVVDVTNSDGDDFDKGLIAFRPSERIALAVRYPAAFVKLSIVKEESSSGSGTTGTGTTGTGTDQQ